MKSLIYSFALWLCFASNAMANVTLSSVNTVARRGFEAVFTGASLAEKNQSDINGPC